MQGSARRPGRPDGDRPVTEQHDSHTQETPSQGIFIGWLALALLVVALLVAAVGIGAGAMHGFK